MIFHAEGLAGNELHYATSRAFSHSDALRKPVITFLLSAESALPAVDEPPADVPFSPRYHCFCVAAHVASLIAATPLQATPYCAAPTGNVFVIIAFL